MTRTVPPPIRVGIRGIAGLLGSRLALAIQRQSDMVVTLGIAKADPTLQRLLHFMALVQRHKQQGLATHLCLDDKHRVVRQVNESSSVQFQPLDQIEIEQHCDILIDTTAPGISRKFEARDLVSNLPVILQSGDYPRGRLIAPPLYQCSPAEIQASHIWRQGDCILSGLMPILGSFRALKNFGINIVMQFAQPLHDYPTDQRVQATYRQPSLAEQLKRELQVLLPHCVGSINVLQVPALDYYTASLRLELDEPISGYELRQQLLCSPRVYVAHESVNSTYEIDHCLREPLRAVGADLPPIVVYGASLSPRDATRDTQVQLDVAFYSRLIAVLPNIDSIRMISRGLTATAAMQATDRHMGF